MNQREAGIESSSSRVQVDQNQREEEAKAHIKYRYRTHPAILANIQLADTGSQGLSETRRSAVGGAPNIHRRFDIERSGGTTGLLPGSPAACFSGGCVWSPSLANVFHRSWDQQGQVPAIGDPQQSAIENINHRESTSAANRWYSSSPMLIERDPSAESVPNGQQQSAPGSYDVPNNQDKDQQLVDELDFLVNEHLSESDKLNLSYYLNEFETNSCDLSELLSTLMQNLLTKLPNSMIKYRLLSLIKQIYIEPSMHINPLRARLSADQKHKLDLRLFEAMTQRYLLASNALICNNALPNAANSTELQKKRRRQRRAAEIKQFNALTAANREEHSPMRNLGARQADACGPQVNGSLAYSSDSIAEERNRNGGSGVGIVQGTSTLFGRAAKPTNGYRSQEPNKESKTSTISSHSGSFISFPNRRQQIGAAGSGLSRVPRNPMELDKRTVVVGSPASSYGYSDNNVQEAYLRRTLPSEPQTSGRLASTFLAASLDSPSALHQVPISDQEAIYVSPSYLTYQVQHNFAQLPHHTFCRPYSSGAPRAAQSSIYRDHLEPLANHNQHNEDDAYCISQNSNSVNQAPSRSHQNLVEIQPKLVGAQSEYRHVTSSAGHSLVTGGQGVVGTSDAFCPAPAPYSEREIARSGRHRGDKEPVLAYHEAPNETHLLTATDRWVQQSDNANDESNTCVALPQPNQQPICEASPDGQFKFNRSAGFAGNCDCCASNGEHSGIPPGYQLAVFESGSQSGNLVTYGSLGSFVGSRSLRRPKQPEITESLADTSSAYQPVLYQRGQQHQGNNRRRLTETASTNASPHRVNYQNQPIQLQDYPAASRSRDDSDDESDRLDLTLFPSQVRGRLSASVAQQMSEQASSFVHQFDDPSSRSSMSKRKPNLQVRRTLRVKIKKSKPILGIAIEGGFNVSGQILPRIVCVHEDGAAYQCGKLRASDLILEVNGKSTVNMTHDEIAKTIADAYYKDQRSHIEFLIGESVHV